MELSTAYTVRTTQIINTFNYIKNHEFTRMYFMAWFGLISIHWLLLVKVYKKLTSEQAKSFYLKAFYKTRSFFDSLWEKYSYNQGSLTYFPTTVDENEVQQIEWDEDKNPIATLENQSSS